MTADDHIDQETLERHKAEYLEDGVTVIEGAIPGPLLSELRTEAEKLRRIAAEELALDAGRRPLHGCMGYADQGVDDSVFEQFCELPRLRAVIGHVLGSDFEVTPDLTIIFEGSRTRVQEFHRDNRHNGVQFEQDMWESLITDMQLFNQFNAALYDDASFWVVPGSHSRPDTEDERRFHEEATSHIRQYLERFPAGDVEALDADAKRGVEAEYERSYPVLRTPDMDDAEYEALALDYLRGMPGSRRIVLGAGDIAFYRQCGWHLGYYLEYHRRAALHGQAHSDRTRRFWEQVVAEAEHVL